MPATSRMSEARLERVRWEGEATYRVLSYYFSLRWNSCPMGDYAQYVLAPFAVPQDPLEHGSPPTPGVPPEYSLLELGRSAKPRYRLLYGRDTFSRSDDPREVLEHLFWHINRETFRGTGNFLLIHAGAVTSPAEEGVLLPGDSGAGKSTLVAALVRAGFSYLSDEAGAIDPVTRLVYPYPRTISLKKDPSGSFGLFADLRPSENGSLTMKREWHLRAEDIRPGALGRPCTVRFIIAPRYRENAPTSLTPVSRAESAIELLRGALNFARYHGRALHLVADVVRGAESYRLESGSLDEAVEAIRELTKRRISRRGSARRPR